MLKVIIFILILILVYKLKSFFTIIVNDDYKKYTNKNIDIKDGDFEEI